MLCCSSHYVQKKAHLITIQTVLFPPKKDHQARMSKLLFGHANDQPKASKMICQKREAKEQWRNRWADDSEWQHCETISKWISYLSQYLYHVKVINKIIIVDNFGKEHHNQSCERPILTCLNK